ncbi:MAG TPA: D-sedoheptulose 7-phosphate isomerase [Candidatus Dormibacteraeota bacterium]|jgi:D-sedoheptulose 7-phosphate isomerase|nr:D-sedoheptulose 7-phosphate isomerase [Candidatus Dormibacteraeota bacterium]
MSGAFDSYSVFGQAIEEHLAVIDLLRDQQSLLQRIGEAMTRAILAGKKVLWCGNGGSAADSQHLAAELMGRFQRERCAFPSIALTTDTSILTAIGNDYGYERVFQRQVEALCHKGDVLVGISTSGASKNVCAALQTARQMGAFTVAFTGQSGEMAAIADVALCIPSKVTARIQEGHILCGHMLCDWVERSVCEQQPELAKGIVRQSNVLT